jgi:hypothetical protein
MMNWKGFGSSYGIIEVISLRLPRGPEENNEKPVRIPDVRA